MGPDLNFAREKGNKHGVLLFEKLCEEHKFFIDARLPGAAERWSVAREKFILAVEELFVQDASNSF